MQCRLFSKWLIGPIQSDCPDQSEKEFHIPNAVILQSKQAVAI